MRGSQSWLRPPFSRLSAGVTPSAPFMRSNLLTLLQPPAAAHTVGGRAALATGGAGPSRAAPSFPRHSPANIAAFVAGRVPHPSCPVSWHYRDRERPFASLRTALRCESL